MAWHIRKTQSEKDLALKKGVLEWLSWKDI